MSRTRLVCFLTNTALAKVRSSSSVGDRPVGLLHFKAVLAEGVGADDSTPPRLVGQAEQGHGVYPEGVGTRPLLHPQVLVEIGDDLLGQLLVSHVGALLLLPKEGLEMVVNSQILVVG